VMMIAVWLTGGSLAGRQTRGHRAFAP
jgi:hypothetical protein